MGWRIEHPGNGTACNPSSTTLDNLANHLAHVLSCRDWNHLKPLFNRPSGDPFHISPQDAATAARLLRKAAGHRKMPPDWGRLARQLAHSAQAAADHRAPWSWE